MNPVGNFEHTVEHNAIHRMEEPCTLCDRRNNMGQLQLSDSSRSVHKRCFEIVEEAERELMATIQQLFPSKDDFGKRRVAHVAAISAVRRACESSIKTYAEQYGQEALKRLFNTEGIAAVKRYHAASKL